MYICEHTFTMYLTTYLVYICYIKLQHSFHLCSFCCFSEMLFIIKILTIDILGIYHGYSDMAWWISFLPLWWGILFMWSKYHFVAVHVLLYIPKTFFNILYFVGIANHMACTFASEFSINFYVWMPMITPYQVANLMKNSQTNLLIFSWVRLRS